MLLFTRVSGYGVLQVGRVAEYKATGPVLFLRKSIVRKMLTPKLALFRSGFIRCTGNAVIYKDFEVRQEGGVAE